MIGLGFNIRRLTESKVFVVDCSHFLLFPLLPVIYLQPQYIPLKASSSSSLEIGSYASTTSALETKAPWVDLKKPLSMLSCQTRQTAIAHLNRDYGGRRRYMETHGFAPLMALYSSLLSTNKDYHQMQPKGHQSPQGLDLNTSTPGSSENSPCVLT